MKDTIHQRLATIIGKEFSDILIKASETQTTALADLIDLMAMSLGQIENKKLEFKSVCGIEPAPGVESSVSVVSKFPEFKFVENYPKEGK